MMGGAKKIVASPNTMTAPPVTWQTAQRIRKRVEEPFGWMKTIGGGHKLRCIGRQRNRAWFRMNAAVYNLIRITALDTQPA